MVITQREREMRGERKKEGRCIPLVIFSQILLGGGREVCVVVPR